MQQEATMVPNMDATFMHWAALTDAYAEKLAAMVREEPGARDEARRLSRELRQVRAVMAPPPLRN